MSRRYGEAVNPAMRYTHRPGAYAILARGASVLLTYQAGTHNEFQLPGGGIDLAEQPLQALHREVLEETGWRIARPRKLGTFRRFAYMPEYDLWAEKVAHIYVAFPVRRLTEPSETEHTAVWVPASEAAALIANPGDAAFMARYAAGSVFVADM